MKTFKAFCKNANISEFDCARLLGLIPQADKSKQEATSEFSAGQIVKGIVTGISKNGIWLDEKLFIASADLPKPPDFYKPFSEVEVEVINSKRKICATRRSKKRIIFSLNEFMLMIVKRLRFNGNKVIFEITRKISFDEQEYFREVAGSDFEVEFRKVKQ